VTTPKSFLLLVYHDKSISSFIDSGNFSEQEVKSKFLVKYPDYKDSPIYLLDCNDPNFTDEKIQDFCDWLISVGTDPSRIVEFVTNLTTGIKTALDKLQNSKGDK